MFKVGDVCEVVYPPGLRIDVPAGTEVTITRVYAERSGWNGDVVYQHTGCTTPCEQCFLRKKPPKDDSEPRADFTPGDWELCPWRPKQVSA